MDTMLSNQKMLFEKLGVGLHSDIDLQPITPLGLENVVDKLDGCKMTLHAT
jgi:hypothetical protein